MSDIEPQKVMLFMSQKGPEVGMGMLDFEEVVNVGVKSH